MAQPGDSKASDPDKNPDAMAQSAGSEKDLGADPSATYGTRSRNRTGNPRPNYAEDKDIEMDNYDYYHDKKDRDGTKKGTRQAATTNGNDLSRGPAASRKAAAVADESKSSTPNSAKEANTPTNGSNSSASNHPSRKRKAAGAGSGGGGGGGSAQSASSAPSTKKTGQSNGLSATSWPETNMLSFENCQGRLQNGAMVADDGTVLEPNDHVYLVCEPPGEPYYLGRIMEFLHMKNDPAKPIDALRVNWYYRPKDIGRKAPDTRMVYATMHSDVSPLTALRGKCQIRHRVEIGSLDDFRKTPDSFWYEKLYDRYIQKNYDLIPTKAIVNVPDKVKKVLDERWKFVLVEQGRGKELTSAVKLCKRCVGYCASNDSVDCAVCQNTYHMNCVRPPLLKKPSRGFAWSCAACSRAQERKLEARHTTSGGADAQDGDDDDLADDDDDEMQGLDTTRTSPEEDDKHHQGTEEQIYQASLWPYRYLGLHCKPEDALDYDDRIYPRASTRIGPRHQANVLPYPGRPVEYVKPLEVRRGKNAPKLSKEAQAAHEAEKLKRSQRPKWVQDEPPGYTVRGEDYDADDPNCTAVPMWIRPPENNPPMEDVVKYMDEVRTMDKVLDMPKMSTQMQDIGLRTLLREDYHPTKALEALPKVPRVEFDEVKLTAAEERRFEEAISKYGSELHMVMKHVKTMTAGHVVRYYYKFKKTERGSQVWGNYTGRKGKKQAKKAEAAATKIADDVADADDDSAFDSNKAVEKKRSFICQFCNTTTSRQWRRAPNATQALVDESGSKLSAKDKQNQPVVALCRRCAELWRRYSIRWEDVDEVAKKVAQAGTKAWKRKQDEELLKELQVVQELVPALERDSTPLSNVLSSLEPPRKKLKGAIDREDTAAISDTGSNSGIKKAKSTAENSPAPDVQKPRMLPCAVCAQIDSVGDQAVSCRECRLTVHRGCYGVPDSRIQGKWVCDMCANDKSPQVSIHYKCVLCPIEHTEQELIEQPKLTHHKKKMSDKDREREKVQVQQARKAAEQYRKRQEELGRPVMPREPLKRTADNNWVHVTCAIWTPEIKFGSAKAMDPSEGIPSIPRARYDETCQICFHANGACVSCHHCRAPFHVECARQHGHLLGFDISPVKSSRRDQFNIVSVNGESGTMSATLWCKDHVPTKTIVHQMYEVIDDAGTTALQLFVQNYKQADLTLTGTVRKANLMTNAAKMSGSAGSRRTSMMNGGSVSVNGDEHDVAGADAQRPGDKVCVSCGIDVTPRWWPIETSQDRMLTNGYHPGGPIGSEARKFAEQRKFQCHKCHGRGIVPRPPPSATPTRHTPEAQPYPSHHGDMNHGAPLQMGGLSAPPQQQQPPPPPQPLPPPPPSDYHDVRAPRVGWPQPPALDSMSHGHHHNPPPPPPPPRGHGLQAPSLAQTHAPPPPSLRPSHHYSPASAPPAPRNSPYGDWGHRPSSQHGSPPRPMNGGSPTMHGGPPPPLSAMTSLRPPPMSAPPPAPPAAASMHSPYGNGPPPSPRRMGGPAPPSPYMSPYHGGHSQSHPPHPSHSMTNGGPPPPPPPRAEAFAHALHPRGSSYGGAPPPPPSRNGAPESRPSSGASSNPSLRNLLS